MGATHSREALLKASLDVFSEHPYEQASLNQIIKNSGVSKGSFYHHFENKEDLYKQLLEESIHTKWTFIHQYTKSHGMAFDTMNIFDKFLYQAKAGMTFAHEFPEYARLANMFSSEKGTAIYEKMRPLIGGDASQMLKEMIIAAYHNGEIETSYALSFVIDIMTSLFDGYDRILGTQENLSENILNLEAFVRFLQNGFGKR